MTKSSNPGIIKTSRRNMLRGSVLAGAAALAGASAGAKPAQRAPKMNAINTASAKLHQAASKQDAASNAIPADLSGYTRVKQELVAPPFAPVHEQVATGGPKIIEVTLETTEKLMTVDEDNGAEIWA
ncbi:MAG: nitrite reductase, copper-containing, partial [Pseudomonadota bacterium]|nr:nitrite reductase, copper-containing [Pseudomonadota bacterium]